jgi:ankyrin repeat protein
MFPWSRDLSEDEQREQAINELFFYTARSSNTKVCNTIKKYQLNLNNDECKDEYKNTLLHLTAQGKNVRLAQQLVLLGAEKYHKNVFDEKAVDIALKNNNLDMIRVLIDYEPDEYLLERIEALEQQRENLKDKLDETEVQVNNLKRKRCDECVVKERDLKKARTDNNKLTKENTNLKKDNTDLKKTVDSLRESFKK